MKKSGEESGFVRSTGENCSNHYYRCIAKNKMTLITIECKM
jgi:hypothetical protein